MLPKIREKSAHKRKQKQNQALQQQVFNIDRGREEGVKYSISVIVSYKLILYADGFLNILLYDLL